MLPKVGGREGSCDKIIHEQFNTQAYNFLASVKYSPVGCNFISQEKIFGGKYCRGNCQLAKNNYYYPKGWNLSRSWISRRKIYVDGSFITTVPSRWWPFPGRVGRAGAGVAWTPDGRATRRTWFLCLALGIWRSYNLCRTNWQSCKPTVLAAQCASVTRPCPRPWSPRRSAANSPCSTPWRPSCPLLLYNGQTTRSD